jgi:integrase/recombinase XerD
MASKLIRRNATKIDPSHVWVRFGAHISQKKKQRDYVFIVEEWCAFLGADVGSEEGGLKILEASDLHAAAYRAWCFKKPGILPSSESVDGSKNLPARKGVKPPGLSNASVRKRLFILRHLYNHLIRAAMVQVNPFAFVEIPKEVFGQRRPTAMVDFELVPKIINLPDKGTEKGARDRAIVAVLLYVGARRSEVCNLKIEDLKRTPEGTPFLFLRERKGGRDDEHPIPDALLEELERYIEIRREQGADDSDPIFPSAWRGLGASKPIYDRTVARIFQRWCKRGGVDHWVGAHAARATAITRAAELTENQEEVRQFAGHSDGKVTQRYIKRRKALEQGIGRKISY